MGGPCDFSVGSSPFGLDFGTLDFGNWDSGLTIFEYVFIVNVYTFLALTGAQEMLIFVPYHF